jgi:peptide/nickel transport system ATP-binding protein
MTELLTVKNLRTGFHTHGGVIRAVDGVDLSIGKAGTLGVVGESGSGKSVTALSIMRLIDLPGRVEAGSSIMFDGRDLATLPEDEMVAIRGNDISMIFQEPMTSLNPVFTVGEQIAESVRLHQRADRKEAEERAVEMMRLVGIPSAEKRVHDYPHQMSGGMRQRVMIGMALSCNPKLLIADEPTTALDVTVQAQILALLERLQRELGMAILMITHDLGVVAEVANDIAVMYAGRIVETASAELIFAGPEHPYTWGLLKSIPRLKGGRDEALTPILGTPPSLIRRPSGCHFHPRCPYAQPDHARIDPQLQPVAGESEHHVACLLESQLRRRLWAELQQGATPEQAREALDLPPPPERFERVATVAAGAAEGSAGTVGPAPEVGL